MRGVERAVTLLDRLLPAAAAADRIVRTASFVALACAAVIAVALFRDGLPEPAERLVASLALAIATAAPGVVLFAFHLALGQLLELPARLRALPGAGRQHLDDLSQLVRERRQRRGLPRRAWRLLALGRSSRELLTPYASLAPLLSVPFVLAAVLSLLATPLLVAVALVALVSLA